LTLRIVNARHYDEPRDAISHDWCRALDEWGMVPVLIPNAVSSPERYVEDGAIDLLVMTGGDAIGATPLRDQVEGRLLDAATRKRLPVLGICRGMQFLSHLAGGKTEPINGHVSVSHTVTVERPLASTYGQAVDVNSFHELGIPTAALGEGYICAGLDADGYAEAMVHKELPFAGVMWHPERPGAPQADRQLIERIARNGGFWLGEG